MNTAIYIRVSTEEQVREGFSISAQKERLTSFVHSQGWNICNYYIDEGVSAKNLQRPELKRLLADTKKGSIDTVLVYRLDRLTRSVTDLYKLLDCFEKNNTSFRSATEVYDTTTAMGRLFITLVAALAQWERENLAERVKFGMEQMLQEGKRAGASSNFGYRFNKDFNCEIIEKEAEAVRRMFQWYVDGYGYQAISDKLNEEGIKPKRSEKWSKPSVRQTLTNEIYIGTYKWGDYRKENNHEPIVDEITFRKVQKMMNERAPSSTRRGKNLLTGIAKCGHCRHALTGSFDKRSGKISYLCKKCLRSTAEYKILNPILNELEKLVQSKEYFVSRVESAENNRTDYTDLKEKLKKLNKQKGKLLDLYMDDGSPFEKNDLYKKISELNEREQDLQSQLQELDIDIESPEAKYDKIKMFIDIKQQFKLASLELKKELLSSIFKNVDVFKSKDKNRHSGINVVYTLK